MEETQKLVTELRAKYESVVVACNRCGFCTSYCPTYNFTGSESHSPRGRNQIFRSIIRGELRDPVKAKEIVDTCLLCGECTAVCFAEVPTAHLMVQARNLLNRAHGMPFWLRLAVNVLLPRPQLLYWVLKASFLAKKAGISWLLRVLGILRQVAPGLATADLYLHHVSLTFLPDLKAAQKYLEKSYVKKETEFFVAQHRAAKGSHRTGNRPGSVDSPATDRPTRPKLALLPVCGSQYLRSSIAAATISVLEQLNIKFIIPETACCGLPAASYGAIASLQKIAVENIKRLERGRYDAIITDDSSCTAHFKEYPKYFPDDPIMFEKAYTLSQKFRELSSYLIQYGVIDLLKKTKWIGGPVAYHDPCKAQYGQKITLPPRHIISSVPGVQLVAVAEADQCCGGGGSYCLVHPDMSQGVLDAKVRNIIASGCEAVVTSSASCLTQLEFGLRRAKSTIKVMHLSEFLAGVLKSGRK